jgi:hypothetical protein
MNMEVKGFQKLRNLCSELHVISQKAVGPNLHSYNLTTSNLPRPTLLNNVLAWILGSDDGECEVYCLMGCHAMQSGSSLPEEPTASILRVSK